ncbi:MAG: tetratricopeptide repeat protein [Candidatus Omnitrophica bacterium]|nr:tetratricopeptide repeat protein [Candidatus Omnitrophota bacterium]
MKHLCLVDKWSCCGPQRLPVAVLAGVLCLALPAVAAAAPGARDVGVGNRLFKAGQYNEAAASYEKAAAKNPSEAAIDYDLGAAYYKAGDFDKAVDSFQKSLLTEDEHLRRNAWFNLGNSLYNSALAREKEDVGKAVKLVEQSLAQYDKVLAAEPKDEDARVNKSFVAQELERLKKKQQDLQKQGKPGSSAQDKNDQDQKKEQQKDQQSGQQQQPQSGQQDQSSGSGQEQKNAEGQKAQDGQKPPENGQGGQDRANPAAKNDVAGQSGEEQGDKKSPGEKPETGAPDKDKKSGEKERSGEETSGTKDAQGGKGSEQQSSSATGQAGNGQLLSQEEARAILDDFDQNEQPRGLLNFIREKRDSAPVKKDW